MNALKLNGLRFRPIYFTPYYGAHQGKEIGGVQIFITNYKKARLVEVQFYAMQVLAKMYPDRKTFDCCNNQRFSMFDKVCGTKYIREKFSERYEWKDVKTFFEKDEKAFKELSKKYYLYK